MEGRPAGPARKIAELVQQSQAQYESLLRRFRLGDRISMETIREVLQAARHSPWDLIQDVLVGDAAVLRPGAPCPADCGGRLIVYASKPQAGRRCRYLRCNRCRARPERNKVMVLEEAVPHRRSRRS